MGAPDLGLVLVEQSVAKGGLTAGIIILSFSHTVTHKKQLHHLLNSFLAVNEKERF